MAERGKLVRDSATNKPITISADTTLTVRQHSSRTIYCQGTHTLTLPSGSGLGGVVFRFKKDGSGVATIAGMIDGESGGFVLSNDKQFVEIESDDTNYGIIGEGGA